MRENKWITSLMMFKRAFSVYRYRIALLVFTGFLSGLTEGLGINTIIPLFSFVVKGQDQPTDAISKAIESVFLTLHIPYTLKSLLILIAFLFIMKALMTFTSNYITDRIRTDYVKRTRSKLIDMTFAANWTFLSKQKIGHLEKVLMNDVNLYSGLISYMSGLVILITNVIVYLVIAFNVSPGITLLTIGIGIIFFLFFKPIMDKVRIVSHEVNLIQKQVANFINESMLGIKTIKAMNFEPDIVKHGTDIFEKLRSAEMKLTVRTSLAYVITQPMSIFVILGIFAYYYKLDNFNFASFAVIVYAINKIVGYVQDAQARLQNINIVYPYLVSVIDFEKKIIAHQEPYQGKAAADFKSSIQFKDVTFAYNPETVVLKNLSLTVKKGGTLGIVGPSGSGKTTIVDLLLSLIRPTEGEIIVDDTPLGEINTKKWKHKIGYVSQDIFIVNDTIRNNITYYNPSIGDAEMIDAAKKAHIYDFVMAQPLGFDTPCGERGVELSGGQRQRIVLARVLARKAEILVLDEATSALDNQSEEAIQKAIEELRGEITTIMIAHRPTTVASADNIIVIKDGVKTEEGSPKDLLNDPESYFYKIYNKK